MAGSLGPVSHGCGAGGSLGQPRFELSDECRSAGKAMPAVPASVADRPAMRFPSPGVRDLRVAGLAGNRGCRHLAHMAAGLTILGIETSCDETAVAVVCDT